MASLTNLRVHASENYDVYIGRPGEWGNQFIVGPDYTKKEAIAAHRKWLEAKVESDPAYLRRLLWVMSGRVLGCPGCKTGSKCHGDNYLRIVREYKHLYKQMTR